MRLRVVGLFIMGALIATNSARAQEIKPPCPTEYVRAAAPGAIHEKTRSVGVTSWVLEDEDDTAVTDLTVTANGVTLPMEGTYEHERAVLPVPPETDDFDIVFDWTQDADTAAGCRGRIRITVLIVDDTFVIGNRSVPRIEGTYLIRYANGDKARWTATPQCDLFACSTRIVSTQGVRGTARIRSSDNAYTFWNPVGPSGSCDVTQTNTFTGEVRRITIKPAYIESQRITIRSVRKVGEEAVTLRGRNTHTYAPTSRAASYDCTGATRVDTFTARRIRTS